MSSAFPIGSPDCPRAFSPTSTRRTSCFKVHFILSNTRMPALLSASSELLFLWGRMVDRYRLYKKRLHHPRQGGNNGETFHQHTFQQCGNETPRERCPLQRRLRPHKLSDKGLARSFFFPSCPRPTLQTSPCVVSTSPRPSRYSAARRHTS